MRGYKATIGKSTPTILDEMTREAANIWNDLRGGIVHPEPCGCPACLYAKQNKKQGRPYGRLLFFARWVIFQAKILYLIENGLTEEIVYDGRKAWKHKLGEYEKALYRKQAEDILGGLLDEMDKADSDKISSLILYLHCCKSRIENEKFIKFSDEFAQNRWLLWVQKDKRKKEKWSRNFKRRKLCQKIANFVKAKPRGKCSRRDILLKYSIKKGELNCLHSWLNSFHHIKIKKMGRSTIFIYEPPSRVSIKAVCERGDVRGRSGT